MAKHDGNSILDELGRRVRDLTRELDRIFNPAPRVPARVPIPVRPRPDRKQPYR